MPNDFAPPADRLSSCAPSSCSCPDRHRCLWSERPWLGPTVVYSSRHAQREIVRNSRGTIVRRVTRSAPRRYSPSGACTSQPESAKRSWT